MAGAYFADTFWWIALANPKDAWHSRVVNWEAAHPGAGFITTEEILSEVLTWFAAAHCTLLHVSPTPETTAC